MIKLLQFLLTALLILDARVKGAAILKTVGNGADSAHDLAEELSGQFEGDIVLNDVQQNEFRKRTGVILPQLLWPNGIVHYEIFADNFTSHQIMTIEGAMLDIQRVSCVRFVPRTATTTDYVRITGAPSGCFSYVGRQGGPQQLNLQPGTNCFQYGTILHELIHALGFYHMQSASDRDQYVTIRWENVQQGMQTNFQSYGVEYISDFGMGYDYGSLMHYSATAFSANGAQTIVPREAGATIGQRVWMSEPDIWRIWAMYKCA
ncbi:zinc metalloproteinase dpy-31 [Culex quinquefasciatus]|uniref:Metalloendopeptidase n=1 Tax=Culex quinquefasciatus TaxID=7176 RepID=B0W779_CULQU|nr:zinc metalloproteinase dpy-31 [Culex quinquefasciatus]|eukprot:XP_001844563.1 zinc metalloproteinase dpy-31 [Culex quinquefasciatus]